MLGIYEGGALIVGDLKYIEGLQGPDSTTSQDDENSGVPLFHPLNVVGMACRLAGGVNSLADFADVAYGGLKRVKDGDTVTK